MRLENLFVENFRCIRRLETELPPGRILVVGDNAAGKTSLLESIYYLVTGRSFRTRYDNDCLRWDAEPGSSTSVRGRVRRDAGDSCRLSMTIGPGTKTVRIDDQPIERLAELWGRLRAVLFTPDDLGLVKGGPGGRRRYLDMGLSQIDPSFLFHLQRYGQALRQRNALLRSAGARAKESVRAEVLPWNTQLIEHGLEILGARRRHLAALEQHAALLHARIADEAPGNLRLRYINFLRQKEPPMGPESHERYRKLLDESLGEDLRRGQTSVGPHRDDFGVLLAGRAMRDFGSQGQVRSCVLALRLAEAAEMRERSGENPLVLLDDLASELDPDRKKRVLELLDPDRQTIMTTTRREDFPDDLEFAEVLHLPAHQGGLEGEQEDEQEGGQEGGREDGSDGAQ